MRALAAPVALVPVVLVLQWWWAVAALLFLAVFAVPLARDRYLQLGHLFDGRRLTVAVDRSSAGEQRSTRARWSPIS